MKKFITLFFISLLMLSSNLLFPQEMNLSQSHKHEACIQSLLSGLNSENEGLRAGCIYMFGELKCDKAVVSLLRLLHSSPREEMRILAALSLYKIGDSRGIFAIKQAVRFDDSERVRNLCDRFYRTYLKNKSDTPETEIALK